jgi:hypothetical protein
MYVEKAAKTTFVRKMRAYNVGEIDPSWQLVTKKRGRNNVFFQHLNTREQTEQKRGVISFKMQTHLLSVESISQKEGKIANLDTLIPPSFFLASISSTLNTRIFRTKALFGNFF